MTTALKRGDTTERKSLGGLGGRDRFVGVKATSTERGRHKEMEDQVRRSITIALIALLALAVAAPMAVAAGPKKPNPNAPVPVDETPTVLEPGAVFGKCDFPILYQLSGKAKLLTLPGGRFITTAPDQTATLTNIDTGKTVTLNITGVFNQTTDENGNVVTMATGRNLLGDPQAGFVLAIGDFSYVFDAHGKLIQPLQGEGQLIDVCGLLS